MKHTIITTVALLGVTANSLAAHRAETETATEAAHPAGRTVASPRASSTRDHSRDRTAPPS